MIRGERAGVQQKVCVHFRNAHYVHCYAHQLNLIMQQATSHMPSVRVFFSDLDGIGLLNEGCQELHPHGGTSTAGSSTLCTRILMT